MAKAKEPVEPDPNKLKRERAGRYVTADARFAVEGNSTGSWYLVDNDRENELGLPLMEGPFATLDEARDAVGPAREGKPRAPREQATKEQAGPAADAAPEGAAPRPPPARAKLRALPDLAETSEPSAEQRPQRRARRAVPQETSSEPAWLARLDTADQATARRLLTVLDRLGIDDLSIVRREIEANLPELSRAVLARRIYREALQPWTDPTQVAAKVKAAASDVRRPLRALVEPAVDASARVLAGHGSPDDAALFAWLVALRTAGTVFAALDSEGEEARVSGDPGWRLVELDGRREPTKRAITLGPSDLLEGGQG